MELHEALRGMNQALRPSGTLVYLDVSWQPLPVRLGQAAPVGCPDIEEACRDRGVTCIRVLSEGISDSRMQNMALLGTVAGRNLVPGVDPGCYRRALEDLLQGGTLSDNLALFDAYTGKENHA
jgi:indolepyruvate ferredoxin oxidoreductase beta subunit